uniref:(California timema) hypothetical protein n=1 Tax=Timema californicum TaxID=61474 RepID=A0A7R9J2B5_TIMCA|nr:unnamed protein product [Timema californicum]
MAYHSLETSTLDHLTPEAGLVWTVIVGRLHGIDDVHESDSCRSYNLTYGYVKEEILMWDLSLICLQTMKNTVAVVLTIMLGWHTAHGAVSKFREYYQV